MGAVAARDAIRAVGGSLDVESQPGRGTAFTARVPVTAPIR
jgi:chemotaxis protein histidine kinase CheA